MAARNIFDAAIDAALKKAIPRVVNVPVEVTPAEAAVRMAVRLGERKGQCRLNSIVRIERARSAAGDELKSLVHEAGEEVLLALLKNPNLEEPHVVIMLERLDLARDSSQRHRRGGEVDVERRRASAPGASSANTETISRSRPCASFFFSISFG